uniref:PR domain zinc finger protein 5-like n=1 Tax=Styela clava TaxID=7725 RepID=UPI001939B722|nr:PR domain zinc finger protein 5-like [Styela clava]
MVLPAEKEHCLRITEQVHHFLLQKSLCDLTVIIQQKEFRLHRVIFSAVCPLLYNLISRATQGTPLSYLTLKLHGLSPSSFQLLIDYIYTGKSPDEADTKLRDEFVKVCCAFKIPFPGVKSGQTVWLTPKDDVQMALLPKNEHGIIEVILQQQVITDSPSYDEMPSLGDFSIGREVLDTPHIKLSKPKIRKTQLKNQDHAVRDLIKILKQQEANEAARSPLIDYHSEEDSVSAHEDPVPSAEASAVQSPEPDHSYADVTLEETVTSKTTASDDNKFAQVYKVHLEGMDDSKGASEDQPLPEADNAESQTSNPDPETSEIKQFQCRKCQAVLREISPPTASSLVPNRKEVRYHCKPCGKWYITLRGKGAVSPNILKPKNVVQNFLASVNGKTVPVVVTIPPKKRANSPSKIEEEPQSETQVDEPKVKQPKKSPAPLKHQCEQCSSAFTRKDVLLQHIKVKHAEDKIESEADANSTNFKLKEGRPQKERPYQCDVCKRRFTRKHSMEEHKRQLHGKVKQIVLCQVCNTKYTSVKSFNMHCNLRHPEGEVPKIRPPARPRPIRKLKTRGKATAPTPSSPPPAPKSPPILNLENENLISSPRAKKVKVSSRYRAKRKKRDLADGMPHEQQSPYYECPVCLMSYKKQNTFLRHVSKCKTQAKFMCNRCPQGFKSKKRWEEHLWAEHDFDEELLTKTTKRKNQQNFTHWFNQTVEQVVNEQSFESTGIGF